MTRYAIGKIKEYIISTHTLTWSVTIETLFELCRFSISTHTLTWSVTTLGKIDTAMIGISTHTLTWSVTRLKGDVEHACADFNSHAHVERDRRSLS